MKCFDSYCGSDKIISVTPKKLLKTNISEKKATFTVKKFVWPPFPVISSMERLMEFFVGVHIAFWQSLCKL